MTYPAGHTTRRRRTGYGNDGPGNAFDGTTGGGHAVAVDQPAPAPTDRTRVRRLPDRGRYDFATVAGILDEGLVCHVGFSVDGHAWVIPTAYARIDRHLYLHGAAGNHALRTLATGVDACVTVTLLDGLVLARSAFHHSLNYRSVMLFGRAEAVTDEDTKRRALTALVEHLIPGRAADTRPPSATELRATRMVRFPLDEASAKVRTGGPKDDPDDLELTHWAGDLPLSVATGTPITDHQGAQPPPAVPAYVQNWSAAGPGRRQPAGTTAPADAGT
jgi:nitroimidazol reductase NimA-like FMN-containing flavoprotein (pyridoxamine 5'-phosphate oxidase superfamily)